MDISLLEIKNCKSLMVERDWLMGMLPTARLLLNGELHTEKTEKRLQARAMMAVAGDGFLMRDRGGDGYGSQSQNDNAYINVMFLEGMITRNGGACTYGSKQIRNLMMQASDDENCMGHVWVLDTPGGLSSAVPDLKMAVDYAHAKGLTVDGIIDGNCASLGIYAGQMCDHLYYTSPENMIGSVGVYGIFDTMKSGDVDPSTGEKHFEIYDPESYDKNAEYRQLAEEGKTDLIIERLKKSGKQFRDFVQTRRPKAADNMLHGKMFECKEVDGILVDGQRTMSEVFREVVSHYKSTHKASGARMTTAVESVAVAQQPAAPAAKKSINPLNNSINMKEKFPNVFALLGVEEMECNEEGSFFNAGLLQTLENKIGEMQSANAEAKALADQLTADKATLEQQLTEKDGQMAQLNAEHAAAVETLKAEHEKALNDVEGSHKEAIAEKDNQISALEQEKADLTEKVANQEQDITAKEETIGSLTNDLNGAKASLETAQNTIVERDQQISDLTAQVTELTSAPGNQPAAGAAPQNNGGGAEAPVIASTEPVAKKGQSYDEMRKTWKGEE